MKVNELIGSLLKFNMAIDDKSEEKSKGVAFKVDIEDYDDQVNRDANENVTESIFMLAKSFSKVMRRLDKKGMGIASILMSKKINIIIQEVETFHVKENMEKNRKRTMEFNDVNMKLFDIFRPNVQIFLGIKKGL